AGRISALVTECGDSSRVDDLSDGPAASYVTAAPNPHLPHPPFAGAKSISTTIRPGPSPPAHGLPSIRCLGRHDSTVYIASTGCRHGDGGGIRPVHLQPHRTRLDREIVTDWRVSADAGGSSQE